jgi:hypothetical protein
VLDLMEQRGATGVANKLVTDPIATLAQLGRKTRRQYRGELARLSGAVDATTLSLWPLNGTA